MLEVPIVMQEAKRGIVPTLKVFTQEDKMSTPQRILYYHNNTK